MPSFSSAHNGIPNVLLTPVNIQPSFNPSRLKGNQIPSGKKYQAIWDTGATGTVITDRVVKECDLKPISMAKMRVAGGNTIYSGVYFVGIILPNRVVLPSLRVSGVKSVSENADVLVGMDIIARGDFAITCKDQKTLFSFRFPSSDQIDFVRADNNALVKKYQSRGPNAPCMCGSGTKYKKCCKNKMESLPR